MARIILSKGTVKGAPDLWRSPVYNLAGDTVHIGGYIDWPGKALPRGPSPEWVFWSNCDIDLACIFSGNEVAELILSPAEAAEIPADALAAASFKVTVA